MNIKEKAGQIVNSSSEAVVGIINSEGYPHAAVRSSLKTDGLKSCYFTSNSSGNMIKSIIKNSKTSVCFSTTKDNITLIGHCQLVNDQSIKESLWEDWFIEHYTGGVNDPEYAVVKFTTEKVSLWVDRKVEKFNI